MNKYIAKPIETFEFSPSGWRGVRVGVYRVDGEKELQVGEYQRNYGSFFNTFFHFRQNDKDLALYSKDYTSTRIMELPTCKDIGGEEPHEMGFCPVDYLVPSYIMSETTFDYGGATERRYCERLNNPKEKDLSERIESRTFRLPGTDSDISSQALYKPLSELEFYNFGFVAGCIWGDDSSWKIQYLDLSEAHRGILQRDERFGYISLPENQSLSDTVDLSDFDPEAKEDWAYNVRLNVIQTFDLRSGKRVHPFD